MFACFLLNSLELPYRHLQAHGFLRISVIKSQVHGFRQVSCMISVPEDIGFLDSLQCLQLFDEKLISDAGDPKPEVLCFYEHPGSPMTGYLLGHMFFSFDSTCE